MCHRLFIARHHGEASTEHNDLHNSFVAGAHPDIFAMCISRS